MASFLSAVGFNFIFPLLPVYMHELTDSPTATVFWAGLAMAVTPLASAICSPFWGKLADRVGYRPMLLRALIGTCIAIGLMALPNAPWQLVLLRALSGGLGSFQPMAMAALSSWTKPEDLSKVVSRLQMAQISGAIAGPLMGGLVTAAFGVRYSPVAGAISLTFGVVLVARWFHEPATRRTTLRGAGMKLSPMLLWLPMLTLVAVQFTDSSFNPILPLLLGQVEPDAGKVAALSGLAASFNATSAAVAAGLAGQRLKHRVRKRTMVVGTVGVALLALAALRAPVPWGVVGLRILVGGMVNAIAVAAYSEGGLAVLPGQRGSAYGWLAASSSCGFAASPMVAGAMAAIDLRAVLGLDILFCLIATASWGFSTRTGAPVTGPVPLAVREQPSMEGAPQVAPKSGEKR
ncbi:MAG TPA: MFS transporter [Chloroflexota bacterium]|nr:MFS transporter [Chloroflexota bacterium]